MAKETKKITGEKQDKSKILIYILAGVTVLLGLLLVATNCYYKDKINNEYTQNPDRDWINNNCRCIEWNGAVSCPVGFTLTDNSCVKGKEFTNQLVACSKYKCPEYIINITEDGK